MALIIEHLFYPSTGTAVLHSLGVRTGAIGRAVGM
jgi:hypothetical protein